MSRSFIGAMSAAMLSVLLFSGCSVVEEESLQGWMNEQRAAAKPQIIPIPEPKKFVPQAYTEEGATDPFNFQKLTQALKSESAQTSSNAALIAPELSRRKEALEAFPLDVLTMVGSVQKLGQPMALIKAENLLYQVRVGSYIGLNYGRVMKLEETQITLREIVQDSAGEWTERLVTLPLKEGSK